MQDLDLQKELTFDEVKHFFSKCDEYEVSKCDERGTFKITLKVTKLVDYDKRMNPKYTYHNIAISAHKPTIQTLIRDIESLGYLKHLQCS